MGFNRAITISTREYVGNLPSATELIEEFTHIGKENADQLPLEITTSIEKSITSNPQIARVSIKNSPYLETLYQQPELLREFSEKEYSVSIGIGYGDDVHLIHSGDMMDIAVSGGSTTDNAINITSITGQRAISRGVINERFPAGTSYRNLVERCFEILDQDFGIQLKAFEDPDLKLEKLRRRPFTAHRLIYEVLNDICRELDMTWGIDARQAANRKQRAFFVDKKSSYDVLDIYTKGPFKINYETGLLGLPGFGKTQFSFNHLPDKVLNVGVLVEVSMFPQINTTAVLKGRINRINIDFSNKAGRAVYRCECQHAEGEFAVLESQRRNTGSEVLR